MSSLEGAVPRLFSLLSKDEMMLNTTLCSLVMDSTHRTRNQRGSVVPIYDRFYKRHRYTLDRAKADSNCVRAYISKNRHHSQTEGE